MTMVWVDLKPGKGGAQLESNSVLGHYLRITRKDDKALKNKSQYIVKETKKDGVR